MSDDHEREEQPIFGSRGVLAYDPIEERIQCHVCGRWLQKIEARHLSGHGLSIPEYKAQFGLNEKTPLEIPRITERRRQANREHEGWRNLRTDTQFQSGHVEVRRDAVREQFRREHYNRQTQQEKARSWTDEEMLVCLRQLQSECGGELRQEQLTLNRPGRRGAIPSRNAVLQRFGSWEHVCKLLGQPYRIGHPRTSGAWSNQGYVYRTLPGAYQGAIRATTVDGGGAVVDLAPDVVSGFTRTPKFWTDGSMYRVYEDIENGEAMAEPAPVPEAWRLNRTSREDLPNG